MKRLWTTWVLVLFAVVGLLAIGGCGDDDDDDDDSTPPADDDDDDNDTSPGDDDDDDNDDDDNDTTPGDDDDDDTCDEDALSEAIAAGKADLAVQESTDAYLDFSAGLDACPVSGAAKMGLAIADAQELMLWFQEALVESPVGGDQPLIALQEIFVDDLLPVADDLYALSEELLAGDAHVRFFAESLPMLYVDDHLLLDLSGEWDYYDMANARSFAQVWQGVGSLLLAFNLNFDGALFADNPPPPDADLAGQIHHYLGLLLEMFADPNYDDFLRLSVGGADQLSHAGMQLGMAASEVDENFIAMRAETDLQEDDIAGYVDANGNGRWDEGETFRVPYFGPLPPEMNVTFLDLLAILDALGVSLRDGGPADIDPDRPNWFLLSELQPVMDYINILFPDDPIVVPPLPLPLGVWFYRTTPLGWRPLAELIVPLLYDATGE